MKRRPSHTAIPFLLAAGIAVPLVQGCKPSNAKTAVTGDAASKVYVPPGKYDEFYNFVSGGFSGQMSVYGLPSGRLLRDIPVFSVDPENGWGYSEETKPMLMTTHGFIPWDDSHHVEASMSNGVPDGKYMFINGNNTPRVAMIDLKTFRTASIIEIPNSAGNHSSPFITPNSEYLVAGTRFSIPMGTDAQRDVPIETYKENFKSTISFVKPDTAAATMAIAFQIKTPAVDFDLAHAGKGPSDGWFFFSCYNTEKAHDLLEVNASQRDKDFIMAVNWKKAEQYAKEGKGKMIDGKHYMNHYDESTHMATSKVVDQVLQLDPAELTDLLDVKDLLNVRVRRLSLGERMKMELIAALIHKPRLIFLDEPTIGLDMISQVKIREFLKYYNQQRKATVILTSHYMEDVEDLCKRVIIINQGHIVFDGDLHHVNDVFAQSKIIKLQLSAPVSAADLGAFGQVKERAEFSATLEVPRSELKERSKAILDRLPVVDFNIEDIPVEEGIALLYRRQEAGHGAA